MNTVLPRRVQLVMLTGVN